MALRKQQPPEQTPQDNQRRVSARSAKKKGELNALRDKMIHMEHNISFTFHDPLQKAFADAITAMDHTNTGAKEGYDLIQELKTHVEILVYISTKRTPVYIVEVLKTLNKIIALEKGSEPELPEEITRAVEEDAKKKKNVCVRPTSSKETGFIIPAPKVANETTVPADKASPPADEAAVSTTDTKRGRKRSASHLSPEPRHLLRVKARAPKKNSQLMPGQAKVPQVVIRGLRHKDDYDYTPRNDPIFYDINRPKIGHFAGPQLLSRILKTLDFQLQLIEERQEALAVHKDYYNALQHCLKKVGDQVLKFPVLGLPNSQLAKLIDEISEPLELICQRLDDTGEMPRWFFGEWVKVILSKGLRIESMGTIDSMLTTALLDEKSALTKLDLLRYYAVEIDIIGFLYEDAADNYWEDFPQKQIQALQIQNLSQFRAFKDRPWTNWTKQLDELLDKANEMSYQDSNIKFLEAVQEVMDFLKEEIRKEEEAVASNVL
ncbi:hypothetical protein CC80DRAFT_505240 [Byssothecium circinans]|uniref:Uncharacterized protein n=1 Tax=Byssothecium circinans TaxID=147558 RepID=A0A6A5U482_9PLEO|nr:hypothetical protein CC80DRAFT_505240 [Byssothecium circinans]